MVSSASAKYKFNIRQAINYSLIAILLLWAHIVDVFNLSVGNSLICCLLIVLSIIFCLRERNFIKVFEYRPLVIWLIWVVYVSIVWLYYGINSTSRLSTHVPDYQVIMLHFYAPCHVMIVTCYELQCNKTRFLRFLFITFLLYAWLGNLTIITNTRLDGRAESAIGNALSLGCIVTTFLSCFINLQNKLKTHWCILIIIFCLYNIFLMATRKALLGDMIIVILWIVTKYHIFSLNKCVYLLLILIVLKLTSDYVLAHTIIGQRMFEVEEQGETFNTTQYKWLNFLGDRSIMYITGWLLFLKHPIFGIGLSNYPIITDQWDLIHSEYMVQLCECGLIGLTLFIAFYTSIFLAIFRLKFSNIIQRQYLFYFMSYMFCLMFIDLTAWTYSCTYFYIGFGLIIYYSHLLYSRK